MRTDAAEVLTSVLGAVGLVYVITHVEDDVGEATVRGALEAAGLVGSRPQQIPPHRFAQQVGIILSICKLVLEALNDEETSDPVPAKVANFADNRMPHNTQPTPIHISGSSVEHAGCHLALYKHGFMAIDRIRPAVLDEQGPLLRDAGRQSIDGAAAGAGFAHRQPCIDSGRAAAVHAAAAARAAGWRPPRGPRTERRLGSEPGEGVRGLRLQRATVTRVLQRIRADDAGGD